MTTTAESPVSLTSPIPETGLDPLDPQFQQNPYPFYRWLLRHDPVHCGSEGTWYVTRYADVRLVMSDERFGCASVRDYWEEMVGPGALQTIMRDTMFFEDNPHHMRLRKLIMPVFSPRRMRAMEPRIAHVVDELLEPLARRGHMDVVSDFAAPLALHFVCELIGIPPEGFDGVRRWSIDIAPTLDLVPTKEEIARGNQAMQEFTDYLVWLVEQRRGDRRDDMISVMLEEAEKDQSGYERPLIMNMIVSTVISVVFAGHDTVTNQVSNTMLALIEHPDQHELLRRDPGLIESAVEESLRYDSSVQSNSRRVDEDAVIGGRQLKKGDFIVALMGAANRDPEVFQDPDRFDVTRQGVQPMSFGAGMRYCLGAVLARLELRAALARLIRLDNLRLDCDPADLRYQRSSMFRSLVDLPVTFTPVSEYPPR
ncbi:cytochrome P450 [Micromonospora sp. NPDC007271]|uniref:cytochrome P450 n=1 Tax=Micromonospora sp. NPDC007271 TaxID=3154587 RepID=UPI0033F741B0